MKVSPTKDVLKMYDAAANVYAEMMDAEIEKELYANHLSRLAERIEHTSGLIIDTSCGTGHMLAKLQGLDHGNHSYVGVDLSPAMIEEARKVGDDRVQLRIGDMRHLDDTKDASAAAVISFFALHHLDPDDVSIALEEWHRVLKPGGQLLLARWAGEGAIDYGEHASIVARNYLEAELSDLLSGAGFEVDQSVTRLDEEMGMDAVYIEATKR